jgi:hypothetical protein
LTGYGSDHSPFFGFEPVAGSAAVTNSGEVSGRRCYRSVAVGSYPVRLLHYKKQKRWYHMLRDHHPHVFRERVVATFDLHKTLQNCTLLSGSDDTGKDGSSTGANTRRPSSSSLLGCHIIIVVRRAQKRRLILNHDDLVRAVEAVAAPVGLAVKVVDWEGMPLREQLQLAVNAVGTVGMHGNGHVWNCLMPPGSAMVEISSDVAPRNEVGPGRNVRNVGNLAGICPYSSLSIRAAAVENSFSKEGSPTHVWKEVDVRVSQDQLREITGFLAEVLSLPHQTMEK